MLMGDTVGDDAQVRNVRVQTNPLMTGWTESGEMRVQCEGEERNPRNPQSSTASSSRPSRHEQRVDQVVTSKSKPKPMPQSKV